MAQVGRKLIHRDSRCFARVAAARRTYQSSFQQLEVASLCKLSSRPCFLVLNFLFAIVVLAVNTVRKKFRFV